NSRLLERDRERIYELSLLNSISSQMNHSLYDIARLRSIVLQRVREIAKVDVCALVETTRETDIPDWLSVELWSLLLQQAHEQYILAPFVLARNDEQPDAPQQHDPRIHDYLSLLPEEINTCIALPLYSVRPAHRQNKTSTHTEGQCLQRTAISTSKV